MTSDGYEGLEGFRVKSQFPAYIARIARIAYVVLAVRSTRIYPMYLSESDHSPRYGAQHTILPDTYSVSAEVQWGDAKEHTT